MEEDDGLTTAAAPAPEDPPPPPSGVDEDGGFDEKSSISQGHFAWVLALLVGILSLKTLSRRNHSVDVRVQSTAAPGLQAESIQRKAPISVPQPTVWYLSPRLTAFELDFVFSRFLNEIAVVSPQPAAIQSVAPTISQAGRERLLFAAIPVL